MASDETGMYGKEKVYGSIPSRISPAKRYYSKKYAILFRGLGLGGA
jgi:hypothetical protein